MYLFIYYPSKQGMCVFLFPAISLTPGAGGWLDGWMDELIVVSKGLNFRLVSEGPSVLLISYLYIFGWVPPPNPTIQVILSCHFG